MRKRKIFVNANVAHIYEENLLFYNNNNNNIIIQQLENVRHKMDRRTKFHNHAYMRKKSI